MVSADEQSPVERMKDLGAEETWHLQSAVACEPDEEVGEKSVEEHEEYEEPFAGCVC